MVFATVLQQLTYVRAVLLAQDEAGSVPAPTVKDDASVYAKRDALLAGSYRPPCLCPKNPGPVPCDASLLALLTTELVVGAPGCPNAGRGAQ